MVEAVGPAGADNRKIVGMLRDVRIPVGNPKAALPMLRPFPTGWHDCVADGPHRGNGRPKESGIGLPASLSSAGFGSNKSMWLGPPSMNSQITDLAFGG